MKRSVLIVLTLYLYISTGAMLALKSQLVWGYLALFFFAASSMAFGVRIGWRISIFFSLIPAIGASLWIGANLLAYFLNVPLYRDSPASIFAAIILGLLPLISSLILLLALRFCRNCFNIDRSQEAWPFDMCRLNYYPHRL